ncbi:hypothetical protein M422DRAFT_54148 [Sphaerobolus stellatus SS14]|uniref:Uncharacterized protein n=1 Tax=Sphaerobolus stellatus (strain SS14) TaxID=990650 RepID=A0A0C9TIQ2_SPHS4|nr:hypothetical protein M422DRAFT_54148 [Sphaerobolus stellatus SS14]
MYVSVQLSGPSFVARNQSPADEGEQKEHIKPPSLSVESLTTSSLYINTLSTFQSFMTSLHSTLTHLTCPFFSNFHCTYPTVTHLYFITPPKSTIERMSLHLEFADNNPFPRLQKAVFRASSIRHMVGVFLEFYGLPIPELTMFKVLLPLPKTKDGGSRTHSTKRHDGRVSLRPPRPYLYLSFEEP